MEQPKGAVTKSASREVRVFVSSTFRDMQTERDRLAKFVFPELHRRCRERGVEFVEVDLRWGVTEAQAEQGEVLPICLAEIDNCRPYFVGLLGHSYGFVPEHIDPPALACRAPPPQPHGPGDPPRGAQQSPDGRASVFLLPGFALPRDPP